MQLKHMHDDIPWQVFAQNGEPIIGQGILKSEFVKSTAGMLCGAAHVWVTRSHKGRREVLLQKRSTKILSWPGYFDVSAAGHIDVGETSLHAAIREAREEVGMHIDEGRLELLFLNKKLPNKLGNIMSSSIELQWVYRYELLDDRQFELTDGEADALEWVLLDDLCSSAFRGEKKVVSHADEYFDMLIYHLKRG